MTKEEFIKEVELLGIKLTEKQLDQLEIYCDFLIEYNTHTNLTSIKEKEMVYLKHFYDSLTLAKVIDLDKCNNLLDIGTGAGFPGMVLKIAYPNLEVTLIDSNNKKITFLKELVSKLQLDKINIYQERAEDFCNKNREKYEIVTARAVSDLKVLSELCLPLTKINGYFIPLKGSNTDEIEDAKYAITELGGEIEKIEKLILPIENSERNIIKIKKIKETSKKYPRRYDKITKSPLKNNGK